MNIVSKHRLLFGTSFLLAGATLYGCKDFLTNAAAPQGTLNQQTLSNQGGVEGSLIAAYRMLDCTGSVGAWGCAASNWVWGSVTGDDAYKGSNATDQPPINDIEAYHWGTGDAESYLVQKWQTVYEGVVRSNATLRLLQAVAATPGAISTADARSIEGEATFLRAHYHFEAYRMWGSIPYYREADADFTKANETPAAVITDLLKDLDSAIVLLPATPRKGQKGRATSWTARAYKGRVQVYAGQFAAAVATIQPIVATGPYALETSFDKVWTGFAAAANGPETIWAYQASTNDGEPNGDNGNFGERLNFPYSGSPFQCCGFHQPSQNLVNFYAVDAAGLPVAFTNTATWNISDANFVAGSAQAVDPRLDFTVGRDGVPYKDWGLYNSAAGWVRDPVNGGFYGPKKNAHEKASGAQQVGGGWQPTQQNSVNIHLFRYADLLLLLAEAEVETGDLAGATAIVNQIRARAGVKAQGPGTSTATIAVPINDPSITWATYRVGPYPLFPDAATARTAVRMERRLELAMEGQRFFDLRRWSANAGNNTVAGDYITVLNAYNKGGVGGKAEDIAARRLYKAASEALTARHRWFPIPAIQIELSKGGAGGGLTQNTGW